MQTQPNLQTLLLSPTNPQALFFIDPTHLHQKLLHILSVLQEENQEIRKYYGNKIEELEKEVERKNKEIEELRTECRKCQSLEWKVLEKDSVIEQLNGRVRMLQGLYKEKLHQYIDRIDFTQPQQPTHSRKNTQNETSKRINISEYFIKAIETSKISTGAAGGKTDNVSTRIDGDISEISATGSEGGEGAVGDWMRNDSDPTGRVYGQYGKERGKEREREKGKLERVKSLDEEEIVRSKKNMGIRDRCIEDFGYQNPHLLHQFSSPYKSSKKILPMSPELDQNQHQYPIHYNETSKKSNKNISPTPVPQNIILNIHTNSKVKQRKLLMEQRWKQISAFQQKRLNISNRRNREKQIQRQRLNLLSK